jgi:hypothetical protein
VVQHTGAWLLDLVDPLPAESAQKVGVQSNNAVEDSPTECNSVTNRPAQQIAEC